MSRLASSRPPPAGSLPARLAAAERERRRLVRERRALDTRFRAATAKLTRLLNDAIVDEDFATVKRYLGDGFDPNGRDAQGVTLLLMAIYAGSPPAVVRFLLGAGADPHLPDGDGNLPIVAAASDAQLAVVRELVHRGADVNARNAEGDTPLTNAAAWGSVKVTRLLLSHGAKPDLADGVGVTPLSLARTHGHEQIATMIERATTP